LGCPCTGYSKHEFAHIPTEAIGRAPAYITEYCRQASIRRPGTKSADTSMLEGPRTRTALGDRSFAVAGPRIWNSLPPSIRDLTLSAGTFATLLKTYLFV